jgi:transcriptional regulator with XRE-family HTH domain
MLFDVVNHKIQPRSTTATTTALDCVQVPRSRPAFHPGLGRFFRELREARDWSIRGAASIAERRDIPLSYQVLFRLERGEVKNPEPKTMRAVARLYELEYAEVVARFVAVRFELDSDQPRHVLDQRSGSHQEVPDVPASVEQRARILAAAAKLRADIATLEDRLREVRHGARDIEKLAARGA